MLLLSASDSLLVTLLVAISNFIWLPIGGMLSDKFGRKPVLVSMTLLAIFHQLACVIAAGPHAGLRHDVVRAAVALPLFTASTTAR